MMAAYLTAKQVAERLQVSVSWVYKHKRLLGAVQIGERMWRFPEEQLSTLLTKRSPSPTAAKRARQTAPPASAVRDWHLLSDGSIVSFESEILGGQLATLDEPVDMRVHHHRDHRVGMAEPVRHSDQRHTTGEQPSCVGMPKVVEVEPSILLPEGMELRVCERPIPHTPEVAARQRPTRAPRAPWGGEHVSMVADELAVRHEGVDRLPIQRDRAPARLSLGALHSGATRVAWVAERADDPQPPRPGDGPIVDARSSCRSSQRSAVNSPQAQPGQRCHQNQGPVAGIDRCDDPLQLAPGEPHLTRGSRSFFTASARPAWLFRRIGEREGSRCRPPRSGSSTAAPSRR